MTEVAGPIVRGAETLTMPVPAVSAALTNDQVTPELVHKRRADAVVLTTYHRVADDDFELVAQWPPRLEFYWPTNSLPDPLFAIEAVRQATIAVAHRAYGAVAGETNFSMRGISVSMLAADWPATYGASLELRLQARNVAIRAGQLRSMQTHIAFQIDGRTVARGSGDLGILRPAAYARLRQGQTAREHTGGSVRLPAGQVGRKSQRDVVIGPRGPGSYSLIVDTSHRYLFDHLLDHVPGMVLLEGARQAFLSLRPGAPIESIRGSFDRYADIEPQITIEATSVASSHVEFSLQQAGTQVASVDITTSADDPNR